MSEFKYLGFVSGESGSDGIECHWRVSSGRQVTGTFRYMVNGRSLQIECARVLYEALLMPVLLYSNETMI